MLEALENNGVKLNKDKCSFMQEAINYLGHTIACQTEKKDQLLMLQDQLQRQRQIMLKLRRKHSASCLVSGNFTNTYMGDALL